MIRTVRHVFQTKAVVTDISGQLRTSENYNIEYCKTERIILKEGIIIMQYFSNFLFFFELTRFELHSDLQAGFINQKARLFLFMMLQGKVSFLTKEELSIIDVEANTCYATYNGKGEFKYNLTKGKHEFCYITPRTAWMKRNDIYYPRIGSFLNSMRRDRKLFGHMSTCFIDKDMHGFLKELFQLKNVDDRDFELNILKSVKSIINHYHVLLDSKFSQRAYMIKDFIDTNFEKFIDNRILANNFFTTEKTLIKTFKQEFRITPHSYLIKVRMEHARIILQQGKTSLSEVYSKVGYSDFQSFRKQFKNYFRMPPSAFL